MSASRLNVRRIAVAAAALLISSAAFAGEPDVVEDFSNFTGIRQGTSQSPNDTGSQWVILGGGTTSTVQGFQVDQNGFHGKGVTWSGAETAAMVGSELFAGSLNGAKPHQVAFTVRFSRTSTGSGGTDIVQVFGAVPNDASLVNGPVANYVVAVGRQAGGLEGVHLYLPNPSGNGFVAQEIAAAPGVPHRIVIQYTPASAAGVKDAKIRLWIDPAAGTDEPKILIESNLGSPAGIGALGRFAVGDSVDLDGGTRDGDVRVGSSQPKVDVMAGWYGTSETRAGSLDDAMAFFEAFGGSAAANWSNYGE